MSLRTLAISLAVAFGLGACSPAPRGPPPIAVALDVPPLASAPDAAAPSPDGVRFQRVSAAVGDRWAVTVRAESRIDDAHGGVQRVGYESDFEVEVLAVEGPAPSRVRLRFSHNVDVVQESERPTVLDGNTYLVERKPPYVRAASGGPAPQGEGERVLDVFPELGTRTRVDQVLPDDDMRIGDRRDDLAGALLGILHPRAWTLKSGSATLTRADDREAIFAVTIDASSTSGLQMIVHGEARIRLADARLSSLALDGTYELDPSQRGTIIIRRTVKQL